MSRDFRILLLGESNAGKTSLINTFLKDVPLVPEASTSTSKAARHLPVVSVPALNGGTLYIVDSQAISSESNSNGQLSSWHEIQIDRADAVVVVCSLEDKDQLQLKAQRWTGAVSSYARSSKRRATRHLPLILAATKSDLRTTSGINIDEKQIKATSPELEAILACSCVNNENVAEVYVSWHRFWHAQQAIESPVYPLYNSQDQALRHDAEQAFNRIYALLSRQSKTISPADLQELQYRVFYEHITASEIDSLIGQIRTTQPLSGKDSLDGGASIALSQHDFHAFTCAFLQRGRAEPVWRILRYYGYNTLLKLDNAYLHPKIALASDGSDCVELSSAGIEFVSQLWRDFEESPSKPDCHCLTHFLAAAGVTIEELANRLAACASLEDFVGRWQTLAANEPSLGVETLALLGYPQSASLEDVKPPKKGQPSYLNVLGATKILRKAKGNRKVFTALLFGDAKSREELDNITGDIITLGEEGCLILLPVPDVTQLSTKRLTQADLAIYAYRNTTEDDVPTSIHQLVSLRETASQKLLDLPTVVVGIPDEKMVKQLPADNEPHPATQKALDFCAAAGLNAPLVIDSLEPLRSELSRRITARQRASSKSAGSTSWLLWSSALAAGMATGFILLQRSGWLVSIQRYWHDRT